MSRLCTERKRWHRTRRHHRNSQPPVFPAYRTSDVAMGQTPQYITTCKHLNDPPGDCTLSYLYYLSSMQQTQPALGLLLNQASPVSPQLSSGRFGNPNTVRAVDGGHRV